MNMSFTCFTTAIHSLCYIHTDVFNRWLTSLSLLHVAQCHYLWTSGNKEASPPQWTHCRHSVDFHVAVVTTASFRTPLCLWLVWLLRLCVSVIRRCALWKWRNTTRMLREILQQRSTRVTWRFSGFPVWSKTYMYTPPPPSAQTKHKRFKKFGTPTGKCSHGCDGRFNYTKTPNPWTQLVEVSWN